MNLIHDWKYVFRVGITFLLLASILNAAAQSKPEADEKDPADTTEQEAGVIEEIVVTSRNREEKLQESPMAVTAFSAKQVEGAGIDGFEDFIGLTPNVSFLNSQDIGTVTLSARGITQVRNGDAPVTVVVDGVYQISPNAINQDLYDIERIEVVKGPQGALYGRNAIGGAVSIITKRPGYEPDYRLKIGLGNENQYKLGFSAGGPLGGDTVLYRVSGFYQDRDGYIPNEFLMEDADAREDLAASLRLMFLPNSDWSIDLKAAVSETDAGVNYFIPLPADGLAGDTSANPSFDNPGRGERNLEEYSIRVQFEAEFGRFTSLTAYSRFDEATLGDLDYTEVSFLDIINSRDLDSFSQEFRFTSPDNRRFRWMAGVYYLDSEGVKTIDVGVDFDDNGVFDIRNAVPLDARNTSLAGFAQINYDLNDAFELSLAARYDQDDREQIDLNTDASRDDTFSELQNKVTLAYNGDGRYMAYTSFAEGFRSGGFNAPGAAAFDDAFDEETTDNFELGFKSDWFRNRLVVNGAIFYTEFKNQQYFVLDTLLGQQGLLNIDESIARGFELEMQARPARGLDLLAAFGLTDTEIQAIDTSGQFFENIPGPLEGNKTPTTNDYSLNLTARYAVSVASGFDLSARVDYERLGRLYWHVDNSDFQDPIDLVHLRLGLQGKSWSVSGFVRNMGDTRYNVEFLAKEYTGLELDFRYPSLPRTYGIEASKKF